MFRVLEIISGHSFLCYDATKIDKVKRDCVNEKGYHICEMLLGNKNTNKMFKYSSKSFWAVLIGDLFSLFTICIYCML